MIYYIFFHFWFTQSKNISNRNKSYELFHVFEYLIHNPNHYIRAKKIMFNFVILK